MTGYRAFRNDDPPRLCAVWNRQPSAQGRVSELTPLMLENCVFAKLYFDRQGLILAESGGDVVGFAHAGFGPSSTGTEIDPRRGVLAALMARPGPDETEILDGLRQAAERYLREKGAESVVAGGTHECSPFYLGLWGGSQIPGVPESADRLLDVFRNAGYVEQFRYAIQSLALTGFRPPIDRQILQWRRELEVQMAAEPVPPSWWQSSVLGLAEYQEYQLRDPRTSETLARLILWDMQPLALSQRQNLRGVFDWNCDPVRLEAGIMVFFLSEILRMLGTERVAQLEFQVPFADAAIRAALQRLNFRSLDTGIVLEKQLT